MKHTRFGLTFALCGMTLAAPAAANENRCELYRDNDLASGIVAEKYGEPADRFLDWLPAERRAALGQRYSSAVARLPPPRTSRSTARGRDRPCT